MIAAGWETNMRKQTWFACVVCVVAVLPGYVVGTIAAILYRLINGEGVDSTPDFLMLRTFFGVETPGQIVHWIWFYGLPLTIQGAVAGGIALFITEKVCNDANYEIAAYVAGAI